MSSPRDPHAHQSDQHLSAPAVGPVSATVVLEMSGLQWASETHVVESTLGRLPGVAQVDANPVGQTATVTYDPAVTSVAELRRWVVECGYHCAGESVPNHICYPMEGHGDDADGPADDAGHEGHAGHEGGKPAAAPSPHDAMGHGGDHAGMSMAGMVADMRHRFLVAAVLSVPILLWSSIGRDVLGFEVAAPVRAARRRVPTDPVVAGRVLGGVDLLRRGLPRAAGPDVGHDGARRGRGRCRLALFGRRDPQRRGRRVLRGRHGADGVRAVGPLVRDACAVAPTTRSAPSSTSPRRWRSCCATANLSRCRPRRSWSVTCC